MCIADIAISRRCYTKRTTLTASAVTKLPANPDRLAVAACVFFNGAKQLGIALSQDDALGGIFLAGVSIDITQTGNYYGMQRCTLSYIDLPGVVHQDLFIFCVGVTGYAIESLMQDDLANELRMYLTEQRYAFKRR